MLAVALTTVVTYLGQKVPRALAIVDGKGVPVPPERDERLARLAAELEAEGFVAHSTVAPADPTASGTTAYARVLVHPTDATRAWAIDMTQRDIVASYVELITEWTDGTAVTTVTHTNPPIFETVPRVHATWLPGADVATAVASHRGACGGVDGERVDPRTLDAVAVAQAQNVEVLEHQTRCGVLKRRGENYGFTLRGARRSVSRIAEAQRTPVTG